MYLDVNRAAFKKHIDLQLGFLFFFVCKINVNTFRKYLDTFLGNTAALCGPTTDEPAWPRLIRPDLACSKFRFLYAIGKITNCIQNPFLYYKTFLKLQNNNLFLVLAQKLAPSTSYNLRWRSGTLLNFSWSCGGSNKGSNPGWII